MRSEHEPINVAAVDLGSNSFHLVIARLLEHDLHILDRARDQVCLAAGLDADGNLSEEAQERAVVCLERFSERLRNINARFVRAVGTNTLRRARNRLEFQSRARRSLGHPIEVIAGSEEARLIYLGVAHSHVSEQPPRLVVDIGGGSTEVILGERFEVLQAHSLFMGCVTHTQRFFPDGSLRKEHFRKAEVAAGLEIRAIQSRMRETGWNTCVGTSGTIHAIREALLASGWSEGGITLQGLKKLRKAMISAGDPKKLDLPTVKAERAQVLPGGLAILIAIFKGLGVESMTTSSGALREGVLYDLVGRIRHEDVRDRTIRRLVQQYHVDLVQAERVDKAASGLLEQIGEGWGITRSTARRQLAWAARLHEIGLAVSHTGYHKHGEYLVLHGDMPGFSAEDKTLLAALIRGHRRKLSKSIFAGLSTSRQKLAIRLCVILRLATLLNRSRVTEVVPAAAISGGGDTLELTFPEGWLESHRLTQADLEQEASALKSIRIRLDIGEATHPARGQGPSRADPRGAAPC